MNCVLYINIHLALSTVATLPYPTLVCSKPCMPSCYLHGYNSTVLCAVWIVSLSTYVCASISTLTRAVLSIV